MPGITEFSSTSPVRPLMLSIYRGDRWRYIQMYCNMEDTIAMLKQKLRVTQCIAKNLEVHILSKESASYEILEENKTLGDYKLDLSKYDLCNDLLVIVNTEKSSKGDFYL